MSAALVSPVPASPEEPTKVRCEYGLLTCTPCWGNRCWQCEGYATSSNRPCRCQNCHKESK